MIIDIDLWEGKTKFVYNIEFWYINTNIKIAIW